MLTFIALCCGVAPGYCSASVSTETTLGPVTMVIGEDVSRWELHFQNLNILLLGEVWRLREGGERAKGEGEVTLFSTQEWPAMLGTNQHRRHEFLWSGQALLRDLNNDLFPSLPFAIRPF